jgi:hypothetical protein
MKQPGCSWEWEVRGIEAAAAAAAAIKALRTLCIEVVTLLLEGLHS